MRLLADENIPRMLVDKLTNDGHDVRWIAEAAPSAADKEVLELAIQETRVLLTFDKDFGSLVFKAKLPASCGVILYRGDIHSPVELTETLSYIIGSRKDWAGHFSVVDERRIRMIPLEVQQ